MVFTSNHNMKMIKSEKLLKKKKRNKKFADFFDMTSSKKVRVQSFANTYFQKRWFLVANTTWK